MLKAVLLPTVRPDQFATFFESFLATPSLADWGLYVFFQGYEPSDVQRYAQHPRVTQVWSSSERVAPFVARHWIYTHATQQPDVWAGMDDDMICLPSYTDLNRAAQWAMMPGVGVVSGNWAKTAGLLARSRYELKMVKQPLVNMAGGQVYGRGVVNLLAQRPPDPYLFCDIEVALRAYVVGLDNYRWLGSLMIHQICGVGGLKVMFAQRAMTLPDPQWLTVRAGKTVYKVDNNYYMPGVADLTPAAHARHKAERAARGWDAT